MAQYSFSGHETFTCRQLWLKKGYDFLLLGNSFSDDDAVVKLGVGKNMVGSIKHWMQAFGLVDSQYQRFPIAHSIFSSTNGIGKDPYLEDIGTLWLLHYLLVSTGKASLYSLIFNEITATQIRFDEAQLKSRIDNIVNKVGDKEVNEKTFRADLSVFKRLYVRPESSKTSIKKIEDDLSSLLIDLGLVILQSTGQKGSSIYLIEPKARPQLPAAVFLYALWKKYPDETSVSFEELFATDGPARIFALSKDGLSEKINELIGLGLGIQFSSDGGIQQIIFPQVIGEMKEEDIIHMIYE